MARPRRTTSEKDAYATTERAVASFFTRHELRYILIEILIVATGVFIALVVDELRQTLARRSLIAETRISLRNEIAANRSRILMKMHLIQDDAIILEAHPDQAAELVKQRRNTLLVPFEAAWTFAAQSDVLRFLPKDERHRLTGAYVINAGYAELVHDEMSAWTQLAGTQGAGASPSEARERDKAIAIWLAYGQRVALASCISIVGLERALDPRVPENAAGQICPTIHMETDPSEIFHRLGVPVPRNQPL